MAEYPNTFSNPGRVGSRVLYCLAEYDVKDINFKRQQAGAATRNGNAHKEGDIVPGIIIKDWNAHLDLDWARDHIFDSAGETLPDDELVKRLKIFNDERERTSSVNLQVFLDGNDSYWLTSRGMYLPDVHDTEKGHWVFSD